MKKFTWNDLLKKISEMSEEQREKQVCVSFEDNEYFKNIENVQFIEEDFYVHIEDNDEIGTLKDLKSIAGEEFDIQNYKLITAKGTPFLWDGF
jgi:hypothetical protein|nr:MAG TPA: hypothetical protein [Caudoviricetes sp.]